MADLYRSRSGRQLLAAIEQVKREHGPSGEFTTIIDSLESLVGDVTAPPAESPGRLEARAAAERSTEPAEQPKAAKEPEKESERKPVDWADATAQAKELVRAG